KGSTLVQAIDAIDPPRKLSERPLRVAIQDVYKIASVGVMPVGRVEAGILRIGQHVRFAPGGAVATVIAPATRAPGEAYPGDHVAFAVSGAALRDLRRGQVCSEHVPDGQTVPACEVVAFTAHVVVFLDHTVTAVVPGYTPVCDAHTAHVPVRVDALVAKLDRRSGQVVEDKPKQLRPGDAAVVRLVPTKPMCVEPYAEFPALGRFALRDQRHTVMVGVVKSVEKKLDDGRIVVWPPPRGSGAKKV
ncbi:elongation factor 1-alpha, partial [Blastocladiella britannica]